MNRLGRGVLGLLLAPIVFVAAVSSGSYSLCAYANEQTEDITIPDEQSQGGELDETQGLGAEPDRTQEAASELYEDQEPLDDTESATMQELQGVQNPDGITENEQPMLGASLNSSNSLYDVCFYIRKNIARGDHIDAQIPSDFFWQIVSNYSDPIRINSAVPGSGYVKGVGTVTGGSGDNLMEDGITASNSVTNVLTSVPDTNAIKAVVPEFDPAKHYVIWYVIKPALTFGNNSDVVIHVDGVIRTRENVSEDPSTGEGSNETPEPENDKPATPGSDEPITPGSDDPTATTEDPAPEKPDPAVTPEDPVPDKPDPTAITEDKPSDKLKPTPVTPDPEAPQVDPKILELSKEVEIQVEALLLDENGNEVNEIVFDGQEHIVGGFAINVIDKGNPNIWEKLIYNYNGVYLRKITSNAEDGYTTFPVRDRVFSINITGAYAMVKELGEVVVDFYSGSRKLNGPEDIQIKDESGTVISTFFSVTLNQEKKVKVTTPIVIEAGTTVKNDDGQTLTNDNYEIISGNLDEGHQIEKVVFNGTQTGVGETANHISSVTIVDSKGRDVTSQYDIDYKDGRLVLVDPGNGVTSGGGSAKGENSATHVNVPYRVGAVSANSTQAAVLGARRAETGEGGEMTKLLIIFACLAVLTMAARSSDMN
ncbi:hypothetical protein [Butyrivibrio sp. AE2032]|uniref:hypothetical protein n=1 Tax=Butyrivibrio sp. AE2032 TaxID=1458463 RepID=UPI00163B50A7|nr:hypothetical protein [Butyrivibrio sp. AE2032]